MPSKQISQKDLERELVVYAQSYIASALGVDKAQIDPSAKFDAIGLSSSALVALVGELEERLDIEISPNVLYEASSLQDAMGRIADIHVSSVAAAQ